MIGTAIVGYLPRTIAGRYATVIDLAWAQGYYFTCDALIVGGWHRGLFDTGMFGVFLQLATAAKLAELLP